MLNCETDNKSVKIEPVENGWQVSVGGNPYKNLFIGDKEKCQRILEDYVGVGYCDTSATYESHYE